MGVWNGWGYGIAIFRALNFQISEPEIWQKFALSAEFQGFSWKIRRLKKCFGLWKMAIPYATNPYPHQVPADNGAHRVQQFPAVCSSFLQLK